MIFTINNNLYMALKSKCIIREECTWRKMRITCKVSPHRQLYYSGDLWWAHSVGVILTSEVEERRITQ